MRIAICDDDKALRVSVHQSISNCPNLPCDATVEMFSGGSELIKNHTEHPYDIIFLDIHMDGMTGIETGHEIRNIDNNVIIIFLTSFEQYVFLSFKIEVFDYIMKPADDKMIYEVLNRALSKYRDRHFIIHIKWHNSSYALDVSDIIYMEGYQRHVLFYTKDSNKYQCVGKLDDYEDTLTPYGFIRCHKGYLVNLNYVKAIENTKVVTIYNHMLDMSTRKKQACLRAFNKFIAKYRM